MPKVSEQSRACAVLIVSAPSGARDAAVRDLASVGWVVSAVEDTDDAFAHVYGGGCEVTVFELSGFEEDPAEVRRIFEPMLRTSDVRQIWIGPGDFPSIASIVGPARKRREALAAGAFPDDDLLEFLGGLTPEASSGVLTARYADRIVKAVLESGALVLCASNDPVDRVGQVCLARRLVTEAQLRTALSIQRTSAEPLGLILRGLARQADVDGALREHYVELFCEVSLWREGVWSFHEGRADAGVGSSISAGPSLRTLVERAAATRKRWGYPDTTWHSGEAFAALDRAAGRVPLSVSQQRVVESLSSPRTIEHLRLELRWTRLEVQRALAELEALHVVRVLSEERAPVEQHRRPTAPPVSDHPTAPPPASSAEAGSPPTGRDVSADERMSAARELMQEGRLDLARHELLFALALEPTHPEALAALSRIDRQRLARARAAQLDSTTLLVLGHPLGQLRDLSPSAAFVLSRLEGMGSTIEDLLAVCPLPEADILEILDAALERDWLTVQPRQGRRR